MEKNTYYSKGFEAAKAFLLHGVEETITCETCTVQEYADYVAGWNFGIKTYGGGQEQ